MPLIIHPESTCDICKDEYTSNRGPPHAIGCGHCFCADCLGKVHPTVCPICRSKYKLDRIKKLHVSTPTVAQTAGPGAGSLIITQYAEHLQMVARVSGEKVSEGEVNEVAQKVEQWIESLAPNSSYIEPIRLALESIYRARATREDLAQAMEDRTAAVRYSDRLEEDKRTFEMVEQSLLAQNDETKQQLDALQVKYDLLLRELHEDAASTRSRSSGGSVSESRSRSNSDKSAQLNGRTAEGVYSITPGAPHSERVLPPPQRKTPNSAGAASGDHRRKEKNKRPEGPTSAPPSGLGLFNDTNYDTNGQRVEDISRNMNRGGAEVNQSWNGANALGMNMPPPQGPYIMPTAPDGWGNHVGNGGVENDLDDLAILSPLDANRNHRSLNGVSMNGSTSSIDVSTPRSTVSWGTSHSSQSSLSVGDMSLNGLPPVASSSSLNLGLTGLDDFHHEEEEEDDQLMTPGSVRHSELARDHPRYESVSAFTPRFSGVSELRPTALRHMSMPVGMTPRVISRSVSEMPVSSREESEEEELEVVGMRFSQSFSDVEPSLSTSGLSTSVGSTSFDTPVMSERHHRRRASTSAALSLVPLDTENLESDHANSEGGGSYSAHPNFGRSVTFSTPKPGAHTTRSQPAALPPTGKNRGFIPPDLTSFTGNGKHSHTPKTVPANPHISATRVVASSSNNNNPSYAMHRGAATISAPLRPLPDTYNNGAYTTMMPSGGRELPPSHFPPPYAGNRSFPQNPSTNAHPVIPPQASYTLQPVTIPGPPEPMKQPRSTQPPAQAPVLHAPQPVSGKSHIGRPWRDWAK